MGFCSTVLCAAQSIGWEGHVEIIGYAVHADYVIMVEVTVMGVRIDRW